MNIFFCFTPNFFEDLDILGCVNILFLTPYYFYEETLGSVIFFLHPIFLVKALWCVNVFWYARIPTPGLFTLHEFLFHTLFFLLKQFH